MWTYQLVFGFGKSKLGCVDLCYNGNRYGEVETEAQAIAYCARRNASKTYTDELGQPLMGKEVPAGK